MASNDGDSSFFHTNSSIAGGGSNGGGGGIGWQEFCERHARASATDFAKSCVVYMNANLPENIRQQVNHRDFMKKFIESFSEHFETEFFRRRTHKVNLKIIFKYLNNIKLKD